LVNLEHPYLVCGVELDGIHFGIGYKFEQTFSSPKRDSKSEFLKIKVKAEVIKVGKHDTRTVKYDDSD